MNDAQGATTTAPPVEPNPRTDRLELLQQLAGTVGVVHKARNPKLNRTVALRQVAIPEWLDDSADLIKRILAEARAVSGFDHPNIARLFTGGYKGFTVFLTSEFVEGQTIKELLAARNLGVAEILALGKQLCSALDYAYKRNVLHNALTPANLKVLPDGNLKVLDFGLFRDKHLYAPTPAKRLESEHYLSPEQLKGKPVSQATNIFSVATILYELLTMRNPFAGKHLGEVDRNITEIDPQPASMVNARVSEAISRVLMKGLAKHPPARFQSCTEFATALDDALKGAPVKAVSPAAPSVKPATAPLIQPKVVQPNLPSNNGASSAPAQVAAAGSSNGQSAPVPAPPTRAAFAGDGVEAPQVPRPAPPEPLPASRPAVPVARPAISASQNEIAAPVPSGRMPVKMLTQWKLVGGIVAALFVVSAVAISLNHRSKTPAPTPTSSPAITAQTPAPVQPQVKEPDPIPETETPATAADVREPQVKPTRQKPARTAAPAPAVATDGQIAVSSDPTGATISIEGRTMDSWKTPQIVGSLAPAVYKVTVSKPGYSSETRNIQVVGGKSVSLDVKLTAVKATLAVRGTPLGARIVIDGKETGKFSPADFILDPSLHSVSLSKEGFFDSTESVKLAAGQTLNYSPNMMAQGRTDNIKVVGGGLKKLFGGGGGSANAIHVEIKSDPKGAQVLINGSDLHKTTPVEIQLDPGNYEVTLQKEGYQPVRKMVNGAATDRVKVDVVLQRQ